MNYDECKQSLYNSKAIADIPDGWKGEVPILFMQDGVEYIGFLFSMAKDGMTVLKRMLAVNIENGEVIEYSVARLKYDFHVYDGRMKAFVITDYDHYFSLKEQYERLLSDIVDGRSTDLEGLVSLAKKILSPEQYKNTILHISGNIYH